MGSPFAQSSCRGRSRGVSYWNRKEKGECLQEDGYSSLLCWRWLTSPKHARPMRLRFQMAHITRPELKATFCLTILGVKKNLIPSFYSFGCYSQRHCHRGGSAARWALWLLEAGLFGENMPSHQQSWKWWMRKCSLTGESKWLLVMIEGNAPIRKTPLLWCFWVPSHR